MVGPDDEHAPDPEPSEMEADVPEADALEQSRDVPLDDDRER